MKSWQERLTLLLRSRKKEQLLTMLLLAAIVVLVAWPTGRQKEAVPNVDNTAYGTANSSINNSTNEMDTYDERENLENILKRILTQVEGIGQVDVAITLESAGIHTMERDLSPEVRGVLIIAKGADNPKTIAEIKEAAMALFHLDAHKIKVMKMK